MKFAASVILILGALTSPLEVVSDSTDRSGSWAIGTKTKSWCEWARKVEGDTQRNRCKQKDLFDDCPVTCGPRPSTAPSVGPPPTPTAAFPCCETLSEKIDEINQSMIEMEERMDEKFDGVNQNMIEMEERMDKKFDEVSQNMMKMEERLQQKMDKKFDFIINLLIPTETPSTNPTTTPSSTPTTSTNPTKIPSSIPTISASTNPTITLSSNPTITLSSNPTITLSSTPSVSSIPTTTSSPTLAPLLAPIISSGYWHACAIDVFHKLFCWGRNARGQVGAGSDEGKITSPTAIEVQNYPKATSLGAYHSCMLDVLSKVWCWGWNWYGQLGLGDKVDHNAPKEVISVSAVKVSAGGQHTCIINILKKLWCWGRNNDGRLGTGTTSNSYIPIEAVGLPNDISDVSVGDSHTCALDILSELYCWGLNQHGKLGLGHTTNKSTPTKVFFNNNHVVQVSLGANHSCIINNLSQVWCWGYNNSGRLGDGTTTHRTIPTLTSLVTAASQVSLGRDHSCVIDNLSDLWCWGLNNAGQLGLGTTSNENVPTKVTAVDDVVQVNTGGYFTLLVDGNDNIMSMGRNTYGQLGLGDTTSRNIPTRLTGI